MFTSNVAFNYQTNIEANNPFFHSVSHNRGQSRYSGKYQKTVFAFVNKDNLIDLYSRKGVVIAYDDTHKVAKGSKMKLCTAWFFYDDMKKGIYLLRTLVLLQRRA